MRLLHVWSDKVEQRVKGIMINFANEYKEKINMNFWYHFHNGSPLTKDHLCSTEYMASIMAFL